METVRKVDVVARFGGEEFVVILPETKKETAQLIAERIFWKLSDNSEKLPKPLTVSIGLASFPLDATNQKDLLHKADMALYAAKKDGKNKVTVYDDLLKQMDVAEEA